MLRIRAIQINVNTNKGLFGFKTEFKDGLNIVKGHNSAGKSTIFQGILYCLGMEELVGSKNEKAMQSVLKNEVLNEDKEKIADVLESSVLLEIQNKEIVTIERWVKSETKNSKLITVYHGSLITGENKELKSERMYVHDAGGATDIKFGFHSFLESFLELNLPLLQYNDGGFRKLYLQTIFPSFVIEQKVGWSDFLATIPFYNLKDKEKRAVEFILALDSWKIEERKQELNRLKDSISEKWKREFLRIKELARRSATNINGLDENPFIINEPERIYLSYLTSESEISITDYIKSLSEELFILEEREIPKIEEIAKEKEKELNEKTDLYNRFQVHYNELINRKNVTQENINIIQERLIQIDEELTHNKHHLKIKKYASDSDLELGSDICPTCNQKLVDSLLPSSTEENTMNIEENISYLQSQKKIAESYLNNHRNELKHFEESLSAIDNSVMELRSTIRAIKRDLIADDRLPSYEIIEKRIRLRERLNFYVKVDDDFQEGIELFINLSEEWQAVLGKIEKLPKESFSNADKEKLRLLNKIFLRLLKKFEYGSKSLDDLGISKDKLIPVAEGQYNIKYNMRLDSSASDLVRAILAYTCALHEVSETYPTNHPGLLMLDEPGTQETAISTLKEVLKSLQGYKSQSIVFASFKQSQTDFEETTEGLKFNLIESEGKKFISKVEAA